MKNRKWTSILIGGIAVLVLALSATLAFAQSDDSTEATTPEVTTEQEENTVQEDSAVTEQSSRAFKQHGGRFGHNGVNNEYLADALGITVEELETAMSEAREAALADREAGIAIDRDAGDTYLADALGISAEELDAAKQAARDAALEQAVADGAITAEEAALIQAREALKTYVDRDVLLADVLGISAEELAAAHAEGIRSTDLLEELGMTVTEAQEALQTAYDDAVAQAVADGVITQAQADQLAEMQVLRDGLGHGGRGGHGHGGCRGGFDGLSGGQSVPETSSGVSLDA
ncbi:MAG: hypothetical protein M9928_14000 [Anaerolineae bacterium]|nr:hypothetical protein [Anaerolineae bacterium]